MKQLLDQNCSWPQRVFQQLGKEEKNNKEDTNHEVRVGFFGLLVKKRKKKDLQLIVRIGTEGLWTLQTRTILFRDLVYLNPHVKSLHLLP